MTDKTIDLAALDTAKASDEGVEIQLKHPESGEPLPAKIRILGADAQLFIDKRDELLNRRVEYMLRRRVKTVPKEFSDAESLDLLVTATIGWSGLTLDGAELAFSAENARRLYQRRGLQWLRDQVDQALGDRSNFLPRRATSS